MQDLQNSQKNQQIIGNVSHLAVIMDGNRRWAKNQGLAGFDGHGAGVKTLKSLVGYAPDYGIKVITAYTFSTENWKRPEKEKQIIFKLLKDNAIKELSTLKEHDVKVSIIGDLSPFSDEIALSLNNLCEQTKDNTRLHLQIALNYGSLAEIFQAFNHIKKELNSEEINKLSASEFDKFLYSKEVPAPEIILRTGGEHRLSNFLLWQGANSYLKFLDEYWPDFNEASLRQVLLEYNDYCNRA